ncbi:lectin-like [Papaver somniferum]|uniref:lectin-like n=1 Tax=Papaver somniferum TaxID=3469 RepID=UPI000E6F62CB|nr:lectin-like [Papaver somniferum]
MKMGLKREFFHEKKIQKLRVLLGLRCWIEARAGGLHGKNDEFVVAVVTQALLVIDGVTVRVQGSCWCGLNPKKLLLSAVDPRTVTGEQKCDKRMSQLSVTDELLQKLSKSSRSQLDTITRNADMNKELETRRRSGIFSNQNKEKCWIDSSGRNCFMLFPRSLNITWGNDTNYWTWLSTIEPSASDAVEIEVSELVRVCWLNVHGKLDTSKLSPGVNYEIVFVVMFQKTSYGWDVPVNLWLELSDGQRLVQNVNLESMPKSQWVEIYVGEFETPQHPGDQQKEINFRLFEEEVLDWKKGLVVEGAIVRPKK